MQVDLATMPQLAQQLMQERKRQRLSRAQAAAVCNVSASFIRDAESDPAGCSLRNLLQFTQGLGLQWALTGWQGGARQTEITDQAVADGGLAIKS